MRKHPDRLVFIDETSVKTNLTRQYGRSLCGKRLEMDAPFGAWGTQTFIAGLKHDNLIAPWVIKGAMDGEAFEAYVRNVLAPELQPGTVVICDNLATHYNQAAAATLREVGCWFLYLPPYSPDLVHGRYDVVCPFDQAWLLHRALPLSELMISETAGHASAEPETKDKLLAATNNMLSLDRR